jgi:hypothetical protein
VDDPLVENVPPFPPGATYHQHQARNIRQATAAKPLVNPPGFLGLEFLMPQFLDNLVVILDNLHDHPQNLQEHHRS